MTPRPATASRPGQETHPITTGATTYAPNALNQITSVTTGAALSLLYDGRGNLTRDNTTSTDFTYNADNLLLNSTKAGVTTTLSYDAEKRLHSVTKDSTVTKFTYDGTDLVTELDGNNTVLRRFVHGPGSDDPIVYYEGVGATNKRYPTTDRQGSVVAVTVNAGTNLYINAYDEYGIPRSGNQGRFQYTGQVWLSSLGLYYYKARFYNPYLGRFMQADPIGYKDGLNWYSYVGNDPLNKTDPSGLARCGSSLQGGRQQDCDKALDDSDNARDNARVAASGLKDIAARMKDGKLTEQDKTDVATVEKNYGANFTSEAGLTKLADGLNGAADKIGARGAGAILVAGSSTSNKPARSNYFTQSIILNDRYFKTSDNEIREQYMLHESAHLNGKWGDSYIKDGINPLLNSNRAFNNADTYSCAVYPSVCGY